MTAKAKAKEKQEELRMSEREFDDIMRKALQVSPGGDKKAQPAKPKQRRKSRAK